MTSIVGGAAPRWWQVRRWPLWSLPPTAVVFVLAVVLLGYGGTATAAAIGAARVPGEDLMVAAVLVGAGVVHGEISLGLERTRAVVVGSRQAVYTDMTSIWTFAAAVLLPYPVGAIAGGTVHLHLCLRARASSGVRHRQAFSNAGVVLACSAAAGTVAVAGEPLGASEGAVGQAVVLAAAMVTYPAINCTLVVVIRALATRTPVPPLREWRGDESLELVTLALGGFVAIALAHRQTAPVILLLPVLAVLHRQVAAGELHEWAGPDPATGLLNSAAWHGGALRILRRAARHHEQVALVVVQVPSSPVDLGSALAAASTTPVSGGPAAWTHAQFDAVCPVAAAVAGVAAGHELVGRLNQGLIAVLSPALQVDLQLVMARITSACSVVRAGNGPAEQDRQVLLGGALWPADATSLRELLDVAEARATAAVRSGPGDGGGPRS